MHLCITITNPFLPSVFIAFLLYLFRSPFGGTCTLWYPSRGPTPARAPPTGCSNHIDDILMHLVNISTRWSTMTKMMNNLCKVFDIKLWWLETLVTIQMVIIEYFNYLSRWEDNNWLRKWIVTESNSSMPYFSSDLFEPQNLFGWKKFKTIFSL